MKKIKILYTIPNFNTAGSGQALLKVATRLDKEQFEPHIMCLHNKGTFFKSVEQSGIPIHIFEFTYPIRPYFKGFFKALKKAKFYRKHKFDIVHSFHYSDEYSEALSVRLAMKKWCYTKKNMSWGSNAWKIRSMLANRIAVQNTDMIKRFFPNNKKIDLIPIGIDTEEFKLQPPDNQLLEELRIGEEQKIILSVANLVPVKGIEFLIQAFDNLADKHKDALLILVGDDKTEYADEMKKMAAQTDYSQRIIFTGKRFDVKKFHSIAHIFVLPTLSKGEGSPAALLEAMATSKYVLGARIPGIKDQLKDSPQNLFQAEDADDLTRKLDDILKFDINQIKEKSKFFRNYTVENHDISKEVEKYQNMYLKMI